MPTDDPGPPVVCRITPDGEVVCEPVNPETPEFEQRSAVRRAKHGADALLRELVPEGQWGPNKVDLALRILEVLGESTLPDTPNIPRRSGEIVDSVRLLLAHDPPSMLLYNYSTLPADIVGAYYLNRGELVQMQRLYDTFKNPVPH